ncbi:peptide deformylase [Halobacteroides halobius DSM 5150]|uniref:Peptide deformylase n=1 Tax=Halobacteroides halobius (strain ATCC 35273 / DSM 5150 / MD-1) TaxID=748449 RepID=L0K6H4_HALHC|nr:peptide deformylase [Halobacteroides halobius]AGB40847.1 peptide deformylase [Halobacteroides halobius DSM 5150]
MSILKIREVGDPVLRTTAKEVTEVTDKTRQLLDNMVETMYDAEGVGLAAPQIGISKRIVVIDVGSGVVELINPQIIDKSEKTYVDQEGCLSIPGETGKVERAFEVTVRALNRDGEKFEVEGKGLLARALQHEIDHLEGKLFTDKTI